MICLLFILVHYFHIFVFSGSFCGAQSGHLALNPDRVGRCSTRALLVVICEISQMFRVFRRSAIILRAFFLFHWDLFASF